MNKYFLGGAMAAAMVVIAPAVAQSPSPPPAAPQVQDRLGEPGWGGRERGGVQTRAELAGHVQSMFTRLDTNRDGSITKAEADAARSELHERFEKRMERRADRTGGDRRAMFDRIDTNRDGTISRTEFDASHMSRDGKGQDRRAERGDHGKMHGMRGMRGGMGGLHGQMFEMADGNRDGRVTLQEATTAAYRHFDSADANRDGQLSRDERKQMHQRMRSERRPG